MQTSDLLSDVPPTADSYCYPGTITDRAWLAIARATGLPGTARFQAETIVAVYRHKQTNTMDVVDTKETIWCAIHLMEKLSPLLGDLLEAKRLAPDNYVWDRQYYPFKQSVKTVQAGLYDLDDALFEYVICLPSPKGPQASGPIFDLIRACDDTWTHWTGEGLDTKSRYPAAFAFCSALIEIAEPKFKPSTIERYIGRYLQNKKAVNPMAESPD